MGLLPSGLFRAQFLQVRGPMRRAEVSVLRGPVGAAESLLTVGLRSLGEVLSDFGESKEIRVVSVVITLGSVD